MTPTTGIVTTGNGEQIINKLLAVTLHHKLQCSPDPLGALDSCFTEHEAKMCGFLMVELLAGHDAVTLQVQHSLSNMVFGFMSSAMVKPVSRILAKTCPVFLQTVKL